MNYISIMTFFATVLGIYAWQNGLMPLLIGVLYSVIIVAAALIIIGLVVLFSAD